MRQNTHFENYGNKVEKSTTTTRMNSREFRGVMVKSSLTLGTLVLVILILISFVHFLNGGHPITFISFLEWISSFDVPYIDNVYVDYSITSDWGPFNFFRNFLNIFTNIFAVFAYLFRSIVNVVSYCVGVVHFLFVG